MRDLTAKQSRRFMNIAMEGKCREPFVRIPQEKIDEFHRTGKLDVIKDYLPDAYSGVKQRKGFLSRLGMRDPVMDYFLKEHNPKKVELSNKLKNVKESESKKIQECLVKIGKAHNTIDGRTVVEFPDGSKKEFRLNFDSPYVIMHKGEIVDSATEKEYKKYLKTLK